MKGMKMERQAHGDAQTVRILAGFIITIGAIWFVNAIAAPWWLALVIFGLCLYLMGRLGVWND